MNIADDYKYFDFKETLLIREVSPAGATLNQFTVLECLSFEINNVITDIEGNKVFNVNRVFIVPYTLHPTMRIHPQFHVIRGSETYLVIECNDLYVSKSFRIVSSKIE
jgi:hypothetical protein